MLWRILKENPPVRDDKGNIIKESKFVATGEQFSGTMEDVNAYIENLQAELGRPHAAEAVNGQ